MSEPNTAEQDQKPVWGAIRLSTGFYLAEIVHTAIQFADTKERATAIKNVHGLLESNCRDEHQWSDAIETLGELCRNHPDRYKESGTWYDGDATLLALALAKEAACAAKFKLYPTLHSEASIEGRVYKVFKYLLGAMAQKPETAASCLKWVERTVNLQSS